MNRHNFHQIKDPFTPRSYFNWVLEKYVTYSSTDEALRENQGARHVLIYDPSLETISVYDATTLNIINTHIPPAHNEPAASTMNQAQKEALNAYIPGDVAQNALVKTCMLELYNNEEGRDVLRLTTNPMFHARSARDLSPGDNQQLANDLSLLLNRRNVTKAEFEKAEKFLSEIKQLQQQMKQLEDEIEKAKDSPEKDEISPDEIEKLAQLESQLQSTKDAIQLTTQIPQLREVKNDAEERYTNLKHTEVAMKELPASVAQEFYNSDVCSKFNTYLKTAAKIPQLEEPKSRFGCGVM